jgi:hypothetical protein
MFPNSWAIWHLCACIKARSNVCTYQIHPNFLLPLPIATQMPPRKKSAPTAKGPPPDYSIVHAVPGYGKPLDYVPEENDPLFVGNPLPSALSVKDLDAKSAASVSRTFESYHELNETVLGSP